MNADEKIYKERFDPLSPERRSKQMSLIKSTGSKAEMTVRRTLHAMGHRYRLHRKDILGTPDITFVSKRKLIFVHGCFWHRHPRCKRATMPKTRVEYWERKLNGNRIRDIRTQRKLRQEGWSLLIVWECEVANHNNLVNRLIKFMKKTK